METKVIAEKLRGLTLGKSFSFEEFKGFFDYSESTAQAVLGNLLLDCYVDNFDLAKYKTVSGKDRDALIERQKNYCSAKINDLYKLYKHLESL